MNVTLPENKLDVKSKVVYISIIGICIISIILVVYLQFFEGRIVTTVGKLKGKSEQGYEQLKAEFNDLFTNSIDFDDSRYQDKKEDATKDLVYTVYTNNDIKEDSYNLDVSLPYINVKSSDVKKFNNEIQDVFQTIAEEILKTTNKVTNYTVQYSASVNDGILSVVISAKLKQGNNAQRAMIQTFNYSLEEDREVTLKDVLNLENVERDYVQNRIDEEIKVQHKLAEDLKAMGNTVFERDLNDDMYKLDNIEEFYFHDGSIYIIFAYGNNKPTTSAMDIVII